MRVIRKTIKVICIIILLAAMGYASNWDLPKETKEDWQRAHQAELEAYYGEGVEL